MTTTPQPEVPRAPVGDPTIVGRLSQMPHRTVSSSTDLIREKVEAGKEILRLMHEEQLRNLEMAQKFADMAVQMQPLTRTPGGIR